MGDLAGAYWSYQRARRQASTRAERDAADEQLDAWDDVEDAVSRCDDRSRALLVALAEVATDAELELLGSGPLEDYFHQATPEQRKALNEVLRRNPRLARAVEFAWYPEPGVPYEWWKDE